VWFSCALLGAQLAEVKEFRAAAVQPVLIPDAPAKDKIMETRDVLV